jgi:hypothetical protein
MELERQMDWVAPNGFSDPQLLEIAKERLGKFVFVGLAERFDESYQLLSHTFGWPTPAASKALNVGTNRPNDNEIPQEAIDLIREHTQLDAQLYEAGKQIFVERYNAFAQSESLKLAPDLSQDIITSLQKKIDLQQRAINQLGDELDTIQNSVGWQFVLRFNDIRQKLIPKGSKREAFYKKVRNLVTGTRALD